MAFMRGYVLLTCLYLLALTSVAGLAAMQASSLMARHALQVDRRVNSSVQMLAAIAEVEAGLVRGEDLMSLSVRKTLEGCEIDASSWLKAARVRVLPIALQINTVDTRQADLAIYEIQACEGGRARIETSVAVVEPPEALVGADLPADIQLGRLSWREVW